MQNKKDYVDHWLEFFEYYKKEDANKSEGKKYYGSIYCKAYIYFDNIQVNISNKDKKFTEDIVFWNVTDLIRKIFEKINEANKNIKIKINEFSLIGIGEVKDENIKR